METTGILGPRGADDEGCEGCAATGRRDFLRQAVGVAAGALAALGLSPEHARALPVEWATPLHEAGNELTLPIPSRDGATIYKEHSLILARYAGAVYAFSLACPHQRAALRWMEDEERFQCSKHKSRYRPNGVYISGRATRSMDRFALRRQGDSMVVSLSRLFREDRDRDAWNGAVVWLSEK
ncbi:MAG TPA: Rieske (2Fe-2S) protein [Longimicrobiaceae bacterium]|nr:Rieske (2Fe-2S) protein [Longimicrobiaceae bacterium]